MMLQEHNNHLSSNGAIATIMTFMKNTYLGYVMVIASAA